MNILVTGGASGLGEAITKKLASDKTNFIYFTYFHSSENARQIEKEYANTKSVYCNFRDTESFNNLIYLMKEMELGSLINNAFSEFESQHFHKIENNEFLISFENNILPVISIIQKAVILFRKNKFGKIITILSSAIINKPPIGWSKYVAEKNYLLSICKSIAIENANFNITSNCISPSFMLTNFNKATDERIIENLTNSHPLKKLLTIEEVAESVNYLNVSSQQINGTNIIMNAASDIF